MARLKHHDFQNLMKEHLDPDEDLIAVAYGVKQPNIFLLILLICIAILPGMIAVLLMTKHYFVGLTNKRLIVLQAKGYSAVVKGKFEYSFEQVQGKVKSSTGMVFTHLKIDDPVNKLRVKFHRAATPENRDNAMKIVAGLEMGMESLNTPPAPPKAATNPTQPSSSSNEGPNIEKL